MNLQRYVLSSVAALMLLSSLAPQRTEAQAVKIAVVDLQRAINETEDGRKSKDKLKKEFEKRQQGLNKKQEQLAKLKDELERQRGVLTQDAMQSKLESYQKQVVELQQVYVEYQRELAEQEGELTKAIVERMERILRRIGQTEGYTLILERNEAGIIYVPINLDLTDVLIQRYNAGEGAEKPSGGKPSGNKGQATPPKK